MSDTGGNNPANNVTLRFDDSAPDYLPEFAGLAPGTYKPTNFDTSTDNFSSPAPAGPYGTSMSVFKGSDPNGSWSLYVTDDSSNGKGSIGGWSLTITTVKRAFTLPVGHAKQLTFTLPVAGLAGVTVTATAFDHEGWTYIVEVVNQDSAVDPGLPTKILQSVRV